MNYRKDPVIELTEHEKHVQDIRERLTEAGNKYSGHVTVGSIEEQMKVILHLLEKPDVV